MFRIRTIEWTAGGREIVRAREVEGACLTIGRAGDNDLQLPDLAVDLHHARLERVAGGGLEIHALGTLPFVRDGADVRRAAIDLRSGTELGFGTYRITVALDEADEHRGEVIGLTVRQGERATTRSGDLETKRGFALAGVVPGKRMMSWGLVLGILAIFLALPIVSHAVREGQRASAVIGDASWNPGALSNAHHNLTARCETCHVEGFVAVRSQTCRTCHKDVHDHADPQRLARARGGLSPGRRFLWSVARAFGKEGPGACRDCHVEHQDGAGLVTPGQGLCVDCHGALDHALTDTRLGNASDFARNHPPFTARVTTDPRTGAHAEVMLAPRAREDNGLAFPHDLHLAPRGGVARMARNLGAERGYGAQGLVCADCHRPSEDGIRFQPIRMERDCEGCHSLAYDKVGGTVRRLHHGDVDQMVADLTARDRGLHAALEPARRRPGARAGIALGGGRGLDPAHALGPGGVCGECHRPASVPGKPGVVPVVQTSRYFEAGWFDHSAHRQAKCTSCHAATTSKRASDVLLPGIATCRTCHAGAEAPANRIASSCTMCHAYHVSGRTTLDLGNNDGSAALKRR
ncbi:cytochrome c3 family protein [Novosphingobium profundi]|uniref:cytochrome c3 family protein n=1 Tax=Novosphingobium profundi TaxID=1774954 RepID=UPI001BDB1254|nr:cytochrome c3 family protein [Novosphingobium profundi]